MNKKPLDIKFYCRGSDQFPVKIATHYNQDSFDSAMKYLPQMLNASFSVPADDGSTAKEADLVMFWGLRTVSNRAKHLEGLRQEAGRAKIHAEDGFLRSKGIGLSGEPALSVIIDDKTPYYDAMSISSLEIFLNSNESLRPEEIDRAQKVMALLHQHRLSKYNHAPTIEITRSRAKSVLLVDQRAGDFSLANGRADEMSFVRMMHNALNLDRDTEIIVKLHPDATIGGRGSCLGDLARDAAATDDRVRLIDFEINPHSLFDISDEVWVATSGMGFEACMRGIPVKCYGTPYYSGWGFTTETLDHWRRYRTRTVEEVFYAAWILYSRYFDPATEKRGEIEDVIAYLSSNEGGISDTAPDHTAMPSI